MFALALFLACSTFLLVLAGGLVTSHEAGLAVPDWPTSYGQWFPPLVGNVFWEHGHRMIAGFVGMLMLFTAAFIQIREKRVWIKQLAWSAMVLVLIQALLGGLAVKMLLPPSVSIAHAVIAQTFFCLTVAMAYFLYPLPRPLSPLRGTGRGEGLILRRLLILTVSLIFLQLILGAITRHTGHMIIPHVIVALLVAVHVLFVVVRVKGLGILSVGLGCLTAAQIFLGIGAFIFTRMVERGYSPQVAGVFFTAVHQSNGALILALGVLITLRVWS